MFVIEVRDAADEFFDAILRENGDAVIALLPKRLDIVAERLKLEPRKARVFTLELLQTPDVCVDRLEHLQRGWRARYDRIDVPGSNLKGHAPGLAGRGRRFNRTSQSQER